MASNTRDHCYNDPDDGIIRVAMIMNVVMRRDSPLRNLRLWIAVLIAHSCAARGELIDLGFSLSEFHEMEFLIRKRDIL